jgi:hypothetical protein
VSGRLDTVSRLCRPCPVPDDAARDACFHELHTPLGGSLEVERLGQPLRIEGVVDNGDLLVEDLLAKPVGEVAALVQHSKCTERVVRERLEQVGEGIRLEHRAIHA